MSISAIESGASVVAVSRDRGQNGNQPVFRLCLYKRVGRRRKGNVRKLKLEEIVAMGNRDAIMKLADDMLCGRVRIYPPTDNDKKRGYVMVWERHVGFVFSDEKNSDFHLMGQVNDAGWAPVASPLLVNGKSSNGSSCLRA